MPLTRDGYEVPFSHGPEIEVAKPFKVWDGGACFKGGGNSHFSYDQKDGYYHETTEVGGLGQDVPIKLRFDFDKF